MTTSINLVVDDHMELISEFYPGLYTNLVPQQGEAKPRRRRRRKKNKGEDGGGGGGLKKRKLSEEQVSMLEMSFGNEHKLESERKDRLASELGLDPRQVAVWFQNRRARWKSKKLEEQYSKLKMEHDSTVVEKCLLESEVLKLKEQLCDAQKEIQRLERCTDGASSNSPSTSFSVEPMEPPPFLGEFGMDAAGFENLFHFSGNGYVHGMEWVSIALPQSGDGNVSDAHQRALVFERWLNRRPTAANWNSVSRTPVGAVPQACATNPQPAVLVANKPGASRFKCYTCSEPGHRFSECRKADRPGKALLIKTDEDQDDTAFLFDQDAIYDGSDEQPIDEEEVPSDQGPLLVVRRVCYAPREAEGESWLCNNIFQSTYTIGGKVCHFVINSGRCEDVVFEEAVQKLNLRTEVHPSPY
ncbi:hypothetical protein Vadar_030006 [Vaccinium darrowii]|uniref:Uncharacterized protein n=1 Tax=Vaccinium darrowii TaxID=229202 RepID=A0ACB7YH50_9ERIC|nr:hypothetical protein Vadar_030006 [Vaccinium darrowii]